MRVIVVVIMEDPPRAPLLNSHTPCLGNGQKAAPHDPVWRPPLWSVLHMANIGTVKPACSSIRLSRDHVRGFVIILVQILCWSSLDSLLLHSQFGHLLRTMQFFIGSMYHVTT